MNRNAILKRLSAEAPACDRVDDDIVWDVIETKIPNLLRALQAFKDQDQDQP